jgi:hypothetical protein
MCDAVFFNRRLAQFGVAETEGDLTQRRGGAKGDAEEEKSSQKNNIFNGCSADLAQI